MIKKIALAIALLGIILYSLEGMQPDYSDYVAQLHRFRSEKNRGFYQSPESPLSAAQKVKFDSLKYYPAAPSFVVDASISRNPHPDTTLILMSDNQADKYLLWGQAQFNIEDKPQNLQLYLEANGTDSTLFIPFTDLSNGYQTYGGGRYLDVPLPESDATEIKLDFNRAYNPYCAYNDEYSCPIPPAENRLQVAITAGEKSFHD